MTNLTAAATATKTLGHPGRLRILAMLRTGPLPVCQMAAALDTPVSTTSGYLLKLRHAGLVREQRRGKWVYYRLTNVEPLTSLLACVLTTIADDPEIRLDAARLRRTPRTAGCDTADTTGGSDDTPAQSRPVRAGWAAQGTSS